MRALLIFSFFTIVCAIGFSQPINKRYVVQLTDDVRLDYQGLKNDSTVPHGYFKVYWKRRILVKGKFTKGIRNGEWIRYYSDGTQAIKANYVNNRKEGEWIYRNDKGDLLAKIHFKRDKRDGEWKGHYPNGKLATEVVFDNDFPNKYIHYYPSGEIVYFGEEDLKYEDHYRNESYYYKNGQIAIYKQTKNDSLNGRHILYHKTGAKWEDLRFKSGKLTSVRNMSTPYGTPRNFGSIKNGTGTLIRYSNNGALFSRAYLKNGILHDTLTLYQKGKVIGQGVLNQGRPVGKWKIYNQFYKLIQEREYFNNGDSIKVKFLQSKHDNEKITGFIVNGKYHGTWKTYNLYNEVISEENYNKGFLHGPYTRYEGKVIREKGNYEWGQKSGQWNYYNSWEKEIYNETFNDSITLDYTIYDLPSSEYIFMDDFKRWENTSLGYTQDHPAFVKFYFFKKIPGFDLSKVGQVLYPGDNHYLGFHRKINLQYSPFFVPPVFPGGVEMEKEFVKENQLVSEQAVQEKVAGFTLVMFKIDEFGFPSNFKVVKKLGYGLDQLSIDLIRMMPFYEPAMFNGLPIETYVVKRIVFPEYD